MSAVFELTNLRDLPAAAEWLIAQAGEQKVWCISGPMGAGKTTLIAAICAQLGVEDAVSSPTYGLVNEYKAGDKRIFHFDLYRLNDLEEALDMGIETYLDSGDLCLIEWPDIIVPLLPLVHLQISLRIFGNQTRQLICDHAR